MLLEHPAGPYDVGATTFALPVRPTGVIGNAGLRTETGQITPALRMEEVSFTAYYPASLSPGTAKSRQPSWFDWVPRYVRVLCHKSMTSMPVEETFSPPCFLLQTFGRCRPGLFSILR